MRRLLILPLLMLAGAVATADAPRVEAGRQGARVRASPRGTVDADIDGCTVGIEYGRPYRRDRVIWGTLVRWNAWWMPGADESTTITTSKPLVFGDAATSLTMPAGAHTIYTLPGDDVFTLIINKQTGQFHTVYHPEQDLGRLPMTKTLRAEMTEQLTFTVEPRPGGGGTLRLIWADRDYSVPFVVSK